MTAGRNQGSKRERAFLDGSGAVKDLICPELKEARTRAQSLQSELCGYLKGIFGGGVEAPWQVDAIGASGTGDPRLCANSPRQLG